MSGRQRAHRWPPTVGQDTSTHRNKFDVFLLDGKPSNLLAIANRTVLTVVFSCLSCPACVELSPKLDHLYKGYAAEGILIVTVYIREAHPGERVPQTRDLSDRLRRAAEFRQQLSLDRPIVVDKMTDGVSSLCWNRANSSAIIDNDGTLVMRARWTTERLLEAELDEMLEMKRRRQSGEDLRPFVVESLRYGSFDRDSYLRGLFSNGPRAVFDVAVQNVQIPDSSSEDLEE